jgi:hypothetical protein
VARTAEDRDWDDGEGWLSSLVDKKSRQKTPNAKGCGGIKSKPNNERNIWHLCVGRETEFWTKVDQLIISNSLDDTTRPCRFCWTYVIWPKRWGHFRVLSTPAMSTERPREQTDADTEIPKRQDYRLSYNRPAAKVWVSPFQRMARGKFQSQLSRQRQLIKESIAGVNESLSRIGYNPAGIVLDAQPTTDTGIRVFYARSDFSY